jgi:hypothetical protein
VPYVYAFVINNEPFYVGKANNPKQRLSRHLYSVKQGSSLKVHNKLRKLILNDETWDLIILEEAADDLIDEREIHWIAHYKSQGFILCNLTDGGEGGSGKLSKEALDRRKHKREEMRKQNDGYVYSEASRLKISQALKGRPKTDQHKLSLSKAWKRTQEQKESQKQKASKTSTGKINIKKFKCFSPDGVEYITEHGLTQFCREHNLIRSCMSYVANGRYKTHKGWTCRKI